MKDKVAAFMAEHQMIGKHILCALSGGADSVALLLLLDELHETLGFTLSAAHFSHNIRPYAAMEEAMLCQQLCEELEIPFYTELGDVPTYCMYKGVGLEEGARILRYDFLHCTALRCHADKIATGHNCDDNGETLLLNLIRGTGLAGLSGIPPVRDNIIRPILCLERREILDYLGDRSYVEDLSNYSQEYTRNRMRLSVFPLLKEMNSRAVHNLGATALRVREENQFIDQCLEDFFHKNARQSEGEISFAICDLIGQGRGFLGRIIHRAYFLVGGDMGKVTAVHMENVIGLILTKLPPKYIQMPSGVTATLKNRTVIFKKKLGVGYDRGHQGGFNSGGRDCPNH